VREKRKVAIAASKNEAEKEKNCSAVTKHFPVWGGGKRKEGEKVKKYH